MTEIDFTTMSKQQGMPRWWGAPRKFDPHFEERRISWLELFYDLVYVIAISRITHLLTGDFRMYTFFGYCCLFALIFWGWLNGSLYHDIHGNKGLRTRLMTLWQMAIISALSITMGHDHEVLSGGTIVVFMIMQFYITYMWWSVGFYDKEHRKYNMPYTILFMIALVLLGLIRYVPGSFTPYLMVSILILNYTPPFIASRILKRNSLDLPLSSSMTERLGLFTIIVFGEVVLGVVNGFSDGGLTNMQTTFEFLLSLAVVFSLWWLFFTLISNRNAFGGFINATLLEILYIPTLVSLGLIAVSFTLLFKTFPGIDVQNICCFAIGLFLACISVMMGMLNYPDEVGLIKKKVRISLFITAFVFVAGGCMHMEIPGRIYLIVVLTLLVSEIVYLNSIYYSLNLKDTQAEE